MSNLRTLACTQRCHVRINFTKVKDTNKVVQRQFFIPFYHLNEARAFLSYNIILTKISIMQYTRLTPKFGELSTAKKHSFEHILIVRNWYGTNWQLIQPYHKGHFSFPDDNPRASGFFRTRNLQLARNIFFHFPRYNYRIFFILSLIIFVILIC